MSGADWGEEKGTQAQFQWCYIVADVLENEIYF